MNELLERLGFQGDPFASTNADDEPLLAAYFVPPPYFATVRGDPANPKSHVVLAPRGGGKSAQRRMIEAVSGDENFNCVTYDRFEIPAGFTLGDASWDYHIEHLCRLITVSLLVALDAEPGRVEGLTKDEKQLIRVCSERFLGDLNARELAAAIESVKTFGDKAKEFWQKFGGPVAGVIDVILERLKLHAVDVDPKFRDSMAKPDSLRYLLGRLTAVSQSVGFASTYVLIDRVDETELTMMDAASTLAFIRPLLVDLATLEHDGLGFKFFLWDAIGDEYKARGARPDRIPIYELHWSVTDLITMISERLKAFSQGSVRSLNQLFCEGIGIDVDSLAAHLASGSPRDLIRLMDRVVAEETRTSTESTCIGPAALWTGVRAFSEIRATELFPAQLVELRRVGATGSVTFTVNILANDIYRVTAQAARARVQGWQNTGMVGKIDEQLNPPNRPMYVYGPIDLRLAIAMLPNFTPQEVLANYALVCPACQLVAISDRQEVLCLGCSHRFKLTDAESLVEFCS
jgi:hypothetical protein